LQAVIAALAFYRHQTHFVQRMLGWPSGRWGW
jgi:hypothetical protein